MISQMDKKQLWIGNARIVVEDSRIVLELQKSEMAGGAEAAKDLNGQGVSVNLSSWETGDGYVWMQLSAKVELVK